MPNISDVILMDVSKVMPERTTKYCVCVSAGNDRYFYINSEHRQIYDDFKIKASDYDFLTHDSYVGCHEAYRLGKELIIRKLGNLNYDDMLKILDKIQKSKRIAKTERKALIFEVETWLNDKKPPQKHFFS